MRQTFFKMAFTSTLSLMLSCLIPCTAQTSSPAKTAMTRPPVTLKLGDNAPPIVAAKWFKGEPVMSFKPGRVYVVEFWATWCGPCIGAMPHLSELARAHNGKATFIGFDVQELAAGKNKDADYITKVANFVRNFGDGMDYTVAADVREGTMYDTWLKAAGMYGIPCTFVINQQGKIGWIGHPMQLDDVLPLVLEGTFSDSARLALDAANKVKGQQVVTLRAALDSLRKIGHTDEALVVANRLTALFPEGDPNYIVAKYELLKEKNAANALSYAAEVNKKYNKSPLVLQQFAEALSRMESKAEKEMAVKMVEQAVTRSAPDDSFAYSRLASVYFYSGDVKKAVAAQERVVAILDDKTFVQQKQAVIDRARTALDKYKSAL